MTVAGLPTGILMNLLVIAVVMFCTHLYLKARQLLGLESLSELCFVSFGRTSIYLINALIAFVIYGILVLYFVLFSRICISLSEEFLKAHTGNSIETDNIFLHK